ncbi:putative cGMP-dependent protein kinase [Haematococcus lacustris]
MIIDSMHGVSVPPCTDIIRQGDIGASEFYVLEEGSCEVWVQPDSAAKPTKALTYTAGSAFGELALLYSSPRAATVRAVSSCKLWVMERAVYHTVKRNFTHEAFVARHKLLDNVPALKHLTSHQRATLVDALQQVDFKAGQTIFKKGDPGNEFFIIREGTAVVKEGGNGTVLAKLSPGQYFGERALLGAEVRAADVIADTRLLCYKLTRAHFDALLGSREDIWRYEALQKVSLLNTLGEQQLWQLAQAMETVSFAKDQVVFMAGDPGDLFYVVQEGSFSCYEADSGKELAKVLPGGCFGELALLQREPRKACVMATTASIALTLSRDQFSALLGNLSQLRNVWRLDILRKVPLLAGLDPKQLNQLAHALQPLAVKSGDTVITQGEVGDKFFIVERGNLGAYISPGALSSAVPPSLSPRVTRPGSVGGGSPAASRPQPGSPQSGMSPRSAPSPAEKPVITYGQGSYFGELALLRNGPRAATVRALSDASLLILGRSDFNRLLGALTPQMEADAEAYISAALRGQGKELVMEEVHATAVLGAGGFGQVLLVKYQNSYHALKCVAKAFVQEQGLVAHIKREKNTMLECRSPFLVNLHGTSQDDQTLYMMMDAVMGGELFGYLQTRTRPLDEAHARFYAASVVCGLQYLHDKELVYRDLKPENLLIDLQGYVKMADFGFVKNVKRGTKTYTLCGTPEYLAPEIIMNKGHNASADWWALGVLIFELVAGLPPFMHQDRLCMFRKACARELTWPKHFSGSLKSLLDRLLDPNPLYRIGSGRAGAGEIRTHPWFAGFDWEGFQARRLPAPYMPKQPAHPGDPVNFRNMTPLNHVFKCKRDMPRAPFDDF